VNPVARNPYDALDNVKAWLRRRKKYNDVAMAYLPVRQDGTKPPRPRRELLAVHKDVVADQQSIFHRTGRNLKCLNDERNDEKPRYQYCRQRGEKLDCGFARFFRLRIFCLSQEFLSRLMGDLRP
jgi:hypothetical protein